MQRNGNALSTDPRAIPATMDEVRTNEDEMEDALTIVPSDVVEIDRLMRTIMQTFGLRRYFPRPRSARRMYENIFGLLSHVDGQFALV